MTEQNNIQMERNQGFILSQASTAGPNRFRSFWSSSAAGNGSYLVWYSIPVQHFTIYKASHSQSSTYHILTILGVSLVLKEALHLGAEGSAEAKYHMILFAKIPKPTVQSLGCHLPCKKVYSIPGTTVAQIQSHRGTEGL